MPIRKVRSKPQKAFLLAFAQTGVVTQAAALAAETIGSTPEAVRAVHYKAMQSETDQGEAYREAFRDAQEQASDVLEAEMRRRAVEGWDEPVFYQGQVVGYVRKFSDTLLIFALKGALPDKYADRTKTEHSGNINMQSPLAGMSPEEISAELGEDDDDAEP